MSPNRTAFLIRWSQSGLPPKIPPAIPGRRYFEAVSAPPLRVRATTVTAHAALTSSPAALRLSVDSDDGLIDRGLRRMLGLGASVGARAVDDCRISVTRETA
jgi:hypothetical protein